MILRILSFIVLFLSAMFLPWPVAMILTAGLMAAFSWFAEAIIIGFLLGVLYSFQNGDSGFLFSFFAASPIIALLVEEFFKQFVQKKGVLSRFIIFLIGAISILLLWVIFKTALHV